ncbi:MAG: hypothetical protein K1X29_02455 [Bdellovibrionales bacterium]|nr:hypothetical protein [Bdellovibrionales bacterium]
MSQKMDRSWCYLPVNKGYQAKIDLEDYPRASAHTWRVIKKDSGRLKVVTNIKTPGGTRQVSLGQFLMNPPKGKMVYPRRFMDGLDYRKANLIVCTMKERQRILPKSRIHGSSKFKGVSFIKRRKSGELVLRWMGSQRVWVFLIGSWMLPLLTIRQRNNFLAK